MCYVLWVCVCVLQCAIAVYALGSVGSELQKLHCVDCEWAGLQNFG